MVLRQQVFTLIDGTMVFQHDEGRVQEILTGRLRRFRYQRDFGRSITDDELVWLRETGYVQDFDETYVKLDSIQPGSGQLYSPAQRRRVYYLNTTLPDEMLGHIQVVLRHSRLDRRFQAQNQDGFVVIVEKGGQPFFSVQDSEAARRALLFRAPYALQRLTSSFVEAQQQFLPYVFSQDEAGVTNGDMNEMLTSRGATPETQGKIVVLAVRQEDERTAINALLEDLGMEVHHAHSGKEAIMLLEDNHCDFLVVDIQLADMHAWTMLGTLKEIINLAHLPTLVLMDEQSVAPLFSVTPVVRPFAIARLRFIIWEIFKPQVS